VIAILAVLIGAVVAVTGSVMANAKTRQTKAVMLNLEQAIEQFKEDAPLSRIKDYRDRYHGYPADELEPFMTSGADGGIPAEGKTRIADRRSIAIGSDADLEMPTTGRDVGGRTAVPAASIKAMALTIRLYSPAGAAILDEISPKYRKAPGPEEFFDRNGNGQLDVGDEPLIYFVDAWGTPFDYFAADPVDKANAPSDPQEDRLKASEFLIKRNRGKPLLVSYGPDGPEQCASDFISEFGQTDLVADYKGGEPYNGEPKVIDSPFNEDNIYLDETLEERLRKLVEENGRT
jgi:hypothetical protein